jgi:hypothetical protein
MYQMYGMQQSSTERRCTEVNSDLKKRIIHHNQVGFVLHKQGWFKIYKSVHAIHHIDRKSRKISRYVIRHRESI